MSIWNDVEYGVGYIAQTIILASNADTAGVAANQTRVGAGALLINGTQTSGGIYTTPDGFSRTITVTTTEDDSAVNITILYTNKPGGAVQTYTHLLVNSGVLTTTLTPYQILSASVDASIGANLKIGFTNVGYSYPIKIDTKAQFISLEVNISGTISVDLQVAVSPLKITYDQSANFPAFYGVTSFTALAASAYDVFQGAASAFRLKINSGTSTAVVKLVACYKMQTS